MRYFKDKKIPPINKDNPIVVGETIDEKISWFCYRTDCDNSDLSRSICLFDSKIVFEEWYKKIYKRELKLKRILFND